MKTACCKKSPAAPYDWSRAGLEIKVIPISVAPGMPVRFGVLFCRGTSHYMLNFGGLEDCNVFARGIAFDIGRAIDFELGVSRKVKARVDQAMRAPARGTRFGMMVDAMLQKPPKSCRPCREK